MNFERQSSVGWLVNVIANDASKSLDLELKKHGLSIALWPTLMCLWEKEGVTQREIANKSIVEKSTMTRTLDKMEKMDLVERRIDPDSRRCFRIYLTEEGKSLQYKLLPIAAHMSQSLLTPLTKLEKQELIKLLQKIVSSIR